MALENIVSNFLNNTKTSLIKKALVYSLTGIIGSSAAFCIKKEPSYENKANVRIELNSDDLELINELDFWINQCSTDLTLNYTVTNMMQQGGYIDLTKSPVIYKSYDNLNVAYWYKDGKDISPSIETIKSELIDYINEKLLDCVNTISSYEKFIGQINGNTIKTEIVFEEEKIKAFINPNLIYETNRFIFRKNKFVAGAETDAIDVFNEAKILFEDLIEKNGLLNITKDYKYDVKFFYGTPDEPLIFMISSDLTSVLFAVDFSKEHEDNGSIKEDL